MFGTYTSALNNSPRTFKYQPRETFNFTLFTVR